MGKNLLTNKQKKEIEKLIKQITEEAKLVVEDYVKNPSNESGSLIYIPNIGLGRSVPWYLANSIIIRARSAA